MFTAAFVDPIAFQVGPLSVRWYGLIFVCAILSAIWTTMKAAEHRGLDPEFVPDIGMVIVPAGILGARLYEVFVLQWPYFREHPGEILAIWQGGLAIHGGVLLALLAGGLYVRYKRQSFWMWADMIGPGLVLAQGIGRWGNFFNQEAYGSPAPQWIIDLLPGFIREGMTIYDPQLQTTAVMHPTFLYESVWNVASFLILLAFQRRKPPVGTVFSLYLILYNIGRLIIESVRMDSSFIFGNVRVAQAMAVLQIVVGMLFLAYHYRRAKQDPAEQHQ